MTNLQLFIAVVIPSALMVVNLLSVYRLEGRLDSCMDRLDARMDPLAKGVGDIRATLADMRTELYEKFQPKAHA